ncbi:MAG: CDP-glycerol glycerophosphotransferase family protein [Oscillospiraceae bacterium]|nr:CDP-glycerol glycerophosphotransferase family protein [Oscillospiraceae bacterium]
MAKLKIILLALYARLMRRLRPGERVWLYTDRLDSVDNAFWQFQHDLAQRDGVRRFYVCEKPDKLDAPEKERKHAIAFGSWKHRLLYLRCEKILTSFSQYSIIHPFGKPTVKALGDVLRFEVIYLQHGVLHARLEALYHKKNIPCDRMVISTDFERLNMVSNYGFGVGELICTGMARYDLLLPARPPERRILLSPSWRQNLIGPFVENRRQPLHEAFLSSRYFTETQAFLNSPRLAAFLEQHGLTLDFQSHPIFRGYDSLFLIDPAPEGHSPRVHLGGAPDLNPYLAMITDYSSIALDFVYLERPLLYFVPDYEDFLAGRTHSYKELHIPLEGAFGPLARTQEALLDALEALAARDFAPEELHRERMSAFFHSREATHRKALYDVLI